MGALNNKEYQEIFTNMQKLTAAIEDNIDTYIDTRVDQGSGDLRGLDSIAPQGRRLVFSQRNQIIAAIVIIIFVIVQIIANFADSNP
jgi:hypothetical protein